MIQPITVLKPVPAPDILPRAPRPRCRYQRLNSEDNRFPSDVVSRNFPKRLRYEGRLRVASLSQSVSYHRSNGIAQQRGRNRSASSNPAATIEQPHGFEGEHSELSVSRRYRLPLRLGIANVIIRSSAPETFLSKSYPIRTKLGMGQCDIKMEIVA